MQGALQIQITINTKKTTPQHIITEWLQTEAYLKGAKK